MAYPSVVTAFSTKVNGQVIEASHINDLQTDVTAIENFVGTLSSTQGQLIYDIRATASDGGGHIQTANKGGTGQTSFAKGDLLVASSSSVLSKLTAGIDGQVLTVSSVTSAGIKWATATTPKVATSGQIFQLSNTTTETSIFSTTISGSTLGSSNALRATVFVRQITSDGAQEAIVFKAVYGSNSVATIVFGSIVGGDQKQSVYGTLQFDLIANGSPSTQTAILRSSLANPNFAPASVMGGKYNVNRLVGNVNSDTDQLFGITAKWPASSSASNVFETDGYIVERII